MQHIVLYCLLSGYAGLLAGIFLMGVMAMAKRNPAEECHRGLRGN